MDVEEEDDDDDDDDAKKFIGTFPFFPPISASAHSSCPGHALWSKTITLSPRLNDSSVESFPSKS